ncbi:unknown protein [Seminavis robusta]|uniref:Uncharacterized protein n=1 Tax=Seminavis robusta TaxID=568900 RepID=A0A9N8DWJ8_9STRA|nr:unknown protein [Seminavis robusta]|eukprot:Sro397_g134570.1 n/a (618) ;mRNA; f:66953-68939
MPEAMIETTPILRNGGRGRGRGRGNSNGRNTSANRNNNQREDDGSPSRKRTAFDPSAINPQTYRSDATQKESRVAPLQAALNFLHGTTATLHEAYHRTVNKVGEEFIKAFAAHQRNKDTLDGMIDGNNQTGELTPSRIPKSVDIKFELKAGNPAMESDASFQALQQESTQAVELYKQTQAKILIRKKQLDVQYAQKAVAESLARGLLPIANGHKVICGRENLNGHAIVNTILEAHHEVLLKHTGIDLAAFRTIYINVQGLATLPDPLPVVDTQQQPQPPVAPAQPTTHAPVQPAEPPAPHLQGPYSIDQLTAVSSHSDLEATQEHIQRCLARGASAESFEDYNEAKERAQSQLEQDHDAAITYKLAMETYQHALAQYQAQWNQHQQELQQYQQALQQHQQALQQFQQQIQQYQQQAQQPSIPELAKLERLITSVFCTPIDSTSTNPQTMSSPLLSRSYTKRLHNQGHRDTAMEIDSEPASDSQQIKDLVKKMPREAPPATKRNLPTNNSPPEAAEPNEEGPSPPQEATAQEAKAEAAKAAAAAGQDEEGEEEPEEEATLPPEAPQDRPEAAPEAPLPAGGRTPTPGEAGPPGDRQGDRAHIWLRLRPRPPSTRQCTN